MAEESWFPHTPVSSLPAASWVFKMLEKELAVAPQLPPELFPSPCRRGEARQGEQELSHLG